MLPVVGCRTPGAAATRTTTAHDVTISNAMRHPVILYVVTDLTSLNNNIFYLKPCDKKKYERMLFLFTAI